VLRSTPAGIVLLALAVALMHTGLSASVPRFAAATMTTGSSASAHAAGHHAADPVAPDCPGHHSASGHPGAVGHCESTRAAAQSAAMPVVTPAAFAVVSVPVLRSASIDRAQPTRAPPDLYVLSILRT
jgi:hypothetical protein